MRIELTEVLWFEQHELSLPELAELSGLPRTVLEELLDCGAITPLEAGAQAATLRFGAAALRAARAAARLHADLELGTEALAVALSLLERIEDLETQLRA
ncbi:MAG: chaperone modulator CbpM, partial [Terriglobales bacterium]